MVLFYTQCVICRVYPIIIRDWRNLVFYTSIPSLGSIVLVSAPFLQKINQYEKWHFQIWLVPESPRWLVARGRLGEAEEVVGVADGDADDDADYDFDDDDDDGNVA